MAPRLRKKVGAGSALNNQENLGGLIIFAASIDGLQVLFGLLAAVPFLGLPIAFAVPWCLSFLGLAMLGLTFSERGVAFDTGDRWGTKLTTLAIMVLVEAIPFVNLGFGFTFGVIKIIRTLREEQEMQAEAGTENVSILEGRSKTHMVGSKGERMGVVRGNQQTVGVLERENRALGASKLSGERKQPFEGNPDNTVRTLAGIAKGQRQRVDGLAHTEPHDAQDMYREAV